MKRNSILFAFLAAGTATPAFADYSLSTLTSFDGTHGAGPYGGLILSGDGSTLYGTTRNGGDNNDGTVFSLPTAGGTPATLASFNGTTGQFPLASVVLSGDGSTLYGTTAGNFLNNYGTVFSVPASGGTPTVLASFNGTNGSALCGGLTLSGSTLYGTTSYGGANGAGTVFSLPTSGGTAPTTLAAFNGANGAFPSGAVTLSADGHTLYGTTSGDDVNNTGTVFAVPAAGGTPTALATFTNGENPCGDLTLDAAGNLYGTTSAGGDFSSGTVFTVPASGGTATILASFNGFGGATPLAGLVLAGGNLYGTTSAGGPNNYGTVFSVPATGGSPTVLALFIGFNGLAPTGNLIADANGDLFGTTCSGGANNLGTVFELSLHSAPPSSGSIILSSGTDLSTGVVGGSSGTGGVAATFSSTTGGTLSITYDPALTLNDLLDGAQGIISPPPNFELPTGATFEVWEVGLTGGSFTGDTQLVFHYDPSLLDPGTDQSLLQIYHYTGGQWVAMAGTVDTTDDTITIETPSFSPFMLGEKPAPVPEPAALSLLAVGALGLLPRRRRIVKN